MRDSGVVHEGVCCGTATVRERTPALILPLRSLLPFINAAAEALKRSRDAWRLFHLASAKPVFGCFAIRAKSVLASWAKAQSQPDSAAAVSQWSFVSIAWSG